MFDCAEKETRCRAVEERLYDPDIGHYTTYGIELRQERGCMWISDVSTSKEAADKLAARIETQDPSPRAFRAVVQDFCEELYLLQDGHI